MIDGGSTTYFFAEAIKNKGNLLVVTNTPSIAEILVENEDNEVIVTGGEMLRGTYALGGSETEIQLQKFYVDKCVIGVIMSERAKEIIIVMDSSKLGTRGFCRAFLPKAGDTIITDSRIQSKDHEALTKAGIKVIIADNT